MTRQEALIHAQHNADYTNEAYMIYLNASKQWTYAKLSVLNKQDKGWVYNEMFKVYPKFAFMEVTCISK